ncbi:MAG: DUF3422 domain-containing protein [Pseudomonadota bacterium]
MPRQFENHPKRFALANELHARPFQVMEAPGRVLHLALKKPEKAADRDPEADLTHLIAFLDRHGAPHPAPGANHYGHDFGRFRLTWERHTEFVSYTLYEPGETDALFRAGLIAHFPESWLAEAPGLTIAATEIELMRLERPTDATPPVPASLQREFAMDSLAMASVLDGGAMALGDFRIHENGFTRFAIAVHSEIGPRRIGRLAQRLIELETYRTMAMLALPIARETGKRLNELENELTDLTGLVAHQTEDAPESRILTVLTEIAAELEALSARTAFRFGAGRAYEALVQQRIAAMRETRLGGRQQFSEFMARRFDPAMRTCQAVERRLSELSIRAGRIAELLRTRVDVKVQAQNQSLLESMDRRADMQLRLQETVEGFSVVAISYYSVSLAGYVIAPLADKTGLSKDMLTALVAIPVLVLVWAFVRRIRERIRQSEGRGSSG